MTVTDQEKQLVRCSIKQASKAGHRSFDIRATALVELGGENLLRDVDKRNLDNATDAHKDRITATVPVDDMLNLLGGAAAILPPSSNEEATE